MKKNPTIYFSEFITAYLKNRPAFFCFIRTQEASLFRYFSDYFKGPILDFGCGDGFFARLVFGKKSIDVGLDLLDSRANEAKEKNVYKKIVTYDGKKFPFKANSFHTVVSNCVLEHVEPLHENLEEIYRVVKPGGYFLTSVMASNWNNYLFGTKYFGKGYITYMQKQQVHLNLFTPKKWEKTFKDVGFSIEKEVGYLSPRTSYWLDVFHYVSIPSLISYKLFKKWVIFPSLWQHVFGRFIENHIEYPVSVEKTAAIFYVLRKPLKAKGA